MNPLTAKIYVCKPLHIKGTTEYLIPFFEAVEHENRLAVEKAKKIAAELETLRQEFEEMRGETEAVETEMARSGNGRYKVVQRGAKAGGSGGSSRRSSIEKARGIAQELSAMQHGALIARAKEDKTLVENWNLVSSFDKDEILEEESRGR